MIPQRRFNERGKNVAKIAVAERYDLDHLRDHLLWIESAFGVADKARDNLVHSVTLGEIDPVLEPAKRIFRHRFIEAGKEGARVDGLHLNSERSQFALHGLRNRLYCMFGRGVSCKPRRAEQTSH